MVTKKTAIAKPTTKSITTYVTKNAAKVKASQTHDHSMSASISDASYKNHRIVIRTSYEITVDGKPVTSHLGVANDGQVHYHPLPNRSFASAVDLVKGLIDIFPDDFPEDGHDSGGSVHHPTPMGMVPGKTRSRKRVGKKTANKKSASRAK